MMAQGRFRFKNWTPVKNRHGGKRRGAGRKRTGEKRVTHEVRPVVKPNDVVHVTLRVDPSIGYLRKREPRRVFNWALAVVGERDDFRICQISIQGNHVHLLCEADHKAALSNGMRAFQISATRGLNDLAGRRGCAFPDRYFARIIRTPTQLRHCLSYLFNNWRHHHYDRDYRRDTRFDPYSSAICFGGFKELSLEESQVFRIPPDQDLLRVALPKTWLLKGGWRRGGGLLSCFAIPGETALSQ